MASAEVRRVCQGPVMPIGGAEDKDGDREILERFVALAGGKRVRIAIVPTASEDPEAMGQQSVEVFDKLGAPGADWVRIGERSDANAEPALYLLGEVMGIFITGGD